jgi:hypothetical protein
VACYASAGECVTWKGKVLVYLKFRALCCVVLWYLGETRVGLGWAHTAIAVALIQRCARCLTFNDGIDRLERGSRHSDGCEDGEQHEQSDTQDSHYKRRGGDVKQQG